MKIKFQAGMTAMLLAVALPLAAQQPPQTPRRAAGPDGMGPRMLNVELAMRQKEQLKLTDAQVSQLEAIRKEIVAERQERARQMIDIESRVAAGLVKREDVRAQIEGKRDDMRKTMEQRRDRIAKILTPEQQDQLVRAERRMMIQRVRARRGGFGGARGLRGGRGFGGGYGQRFRGGFDPDFGPGFGARRPLPPRPPRAPGFDDEN